MFLPLPVRPIRLLLMDGRDLVGRSTKARAGRNQSVVLLSKNQADDLQKLASVA